MTTDTERSAARCETFAHALTAIDRMYQAGDLDRATWIAAVDNLRLVAARANLVNNLEHMLAKVNDPAMPEATRVHYYDELLAARELHGDTVADRLERATWSPMDDTLAGFMAENFRRDPTGIDCWEAHEGVEA